MKTILVIEDDSLLRHAIAEVLLDAGYSVQEAEDGSRALEMINRNIPDLIICDIAMPKMSGFDVLKKLHNDDTEFAIPFVFLTAFTDPGTHREGMNLGADDYLFKPVRLTDLLAVIRTRLEKHDRLKREAEKKLEILRHNIINSLPHEFRTPVSLVMGYARLLAQDNYRSTKGIDEALQIIMDSADRLQNLTEQFWAYAEVEVLAADRERMECLRNTGICYPALVLPSIIESCVEKYQRHHDVGLQPAVTMLRIMDSHFTRIMQELLDNALKFSEPGTTVMVNIRPHSEMAHIEIADHGRGMTREQVAQIGAHMQFNRSYFEQPGAGLGLITARRLVELYGGSLTIQSEAELGTTVTLAIPVAQDNQWGIEGV
ncbi:MAG: response regulator [Anaerolineae bacterium]|nr:response regulator [Anaerolineae bacterium]